MTSTLKATHRTMRMFPTNESRRRSYDAHPQAAPIWRWLIGPDGRAQKQVKVLSDSESDEEEESLANPGAKEAGEDDEDEELIDEEDEKPQEKLSDAAKVRGTQACTTTVTVLNAVALCVESPKDAQGLQ